MRRFHVPAMAGFAAILVLVGCSDDESSSPSSTPDAQADVTSDSSVGGAGGQEAGAAGQAGTGGEIMDAAVEASPEASLPTCGDPGSFSCTPFDPATDLVAPASDCTTEQVHQFILDCWQGGSASQEKCDPWLPSGNIGTTPCGVCLNDWLTEELYPNTLACHYRFLGGTDPANQTKCRNAVKCINGCGAAACGRTICDDVIADSEGKTEYQRCYELDSVWGETGSCMVLESDGAAIGPTVDACAAEKSYKDGTVNCRISSSHPGTIAAQIEGFYRGACRDNGDWTNVNDPKLW